MNKNQENKLTMFKTVIAVLNNNSALFSAFAPFQAQVTDFDSVYNQILTEIAAQSEPTTGYTTQKGALREQAVKLGLLIALKIKAYAKLTNNSVLYSRYDITASGFNGKRDTELVSMLNEIHSTATANIANLAAYNLTPAQLATFSSAITDYHNEVTSPRLVINDKVYAGENIERLLTEGTDILKTLDGLILEYETSDPAFYFAYTKSRKIINFGHRNTRIQLFVELEDGVDATGTPVIIQKGDTTYMEKVTGGEALFESVKVGNYTLTIQKAGYANYTTQIRSKSGTTVTENIVLTLE